MRRRPVAALVLLTACANDDGGSGIDLAAARAEISNPVEAPGRVLGVSSRGQVLVTNDDELCLLDTDGAELDCWSPAARPNPGSIVRWSPDATKVAFDEYANLRALSGSAVHVLDIDTGDVRVVSAGGDEVAVLPAWVDDDELAFVRLADDQLVDVVSTDVDGDGGDDDIVSTDVAFQDVGILAGAVDGDYLMSVRRGDTTEVVAVDDDGTRPVTDADSQAVTFGGSNRDGDDAVLVVAPDARSSFSPVTLLGDDGEAVRSEFVAWSGAVAPAGGTVAAVSVDGDSFESSLVLWDPQSGDSRRLDDAGEVDGEFLGVVWTADDQVVMWSPDSWQVATLSAD